MRKEGLNSKKITSLVIALMLILTVFSAFAVIGYADTETVIEDGRSFTLNDELSLSKDLPVVPKTFEATVKINADVKTPGIIFGNYSSADGAMLNFEIAYGGKPRLYMRDENGNLFDVAFNTDVRSGEFVHIAITHTVLSNGSAEFSLYINGAKKETKTNSMSCNIDSVLLQREVTLMLGRDSRWRNEQYFKGNIKNFALYSEPLSSNEVLSAYQSGLAADLTSRMAYYDLTLESNNTGKRVKDSTANGYDFESIFYSREESVGEYDYSFAIVGDIQCLVEHDTEYDKTYTNAIYDWLVKNADSKKIKYVLGLGDITQDNIDTEWTTAKNQILKLNGKIPYSLINGNHDSVAQLNNYFASDVNFTSQEIGYYDGTSLGNYYVKFNVGGNKYMIVALQFAPSNAMLEWANNVIGTNPEYQVIITTHAYLDGDGEVLVAGDGGEPSHYNKNNPNGDVMWEKLVSQNRNIKMIFSGHIAADNIVYRSDEGKEGNTVHQLLVNPQGMDHAYNYETGMVAMLYFSDGGNTVKIEYISAYDSLKAQENDETAEDVLFGRKNQFTLDLTAKEPENKGEINVWLIGGQSNAVGYANDLSAYVSKDPRYINGFDNVLYYGYGEQWQSNFTPARVGLGQNNKKSGIEIGIANALGNTGEMNAIIKYAEGGTYLAPTNAAKGTWTSPSYIEANSISTDGNKIGYLYNSFIDTVEAAIYELRQMGYTPVIQGMWWMQGCAESYDSYSEQYEALLRALINDVRADVEERCGVETTDMPFVFGKIIFNPNGDRIPAGYLESGSYYNKVLLAQNNVANDTSLKNVSMVDAKTDFASGFGQVDTWHYNAATQDYLGKRFVDEVNAFNAKCIVSGYGANASISGGGLYKSGDTVTVTFNAPSGFVVSGVTMSADGGASTPVSLTNGKYTFTSNGQNVVFSIETIGGIAEITDYGTIPAEYPENEYPFAIFENGSFLFAKANWTSAVLAAYNELRGTAGLGKNVTILLRTDYTTSVLDASASYLTHFNGSFTFDLGNNTFTRADGYLFDIYASVTDNTLFTTQIILKNGTVIAKKVPLIGLNHTASSVLNGSLKHFDFDFENVTFEIAPGTSIASGFITACWEAGNYGITADLTFTDCTFDFSNAIKDTVMINLAGDNKSLTKVSVDISGGNIIASKNKITFIKTDTGDSIGFSKNSAGNYVTLTAPAGADITAFTGAYVSTDLTKTLLFELASESQSVKTYNIKESNYVKPIETKYGNIPEKYSSDTEYPLAVFKPNAEKETGYEFVEAYSDWKAAVNAALNGYVIYFRADFDLTDSLSSAYLTGKTVSFTVDLNGKTLTKVGKTYIFDDPLQAAKTNTHVIFMNGTIAHASTSTWRPFFNYNTQSTNTVNESDLDYTFNNVTFRDNRSIADARTIFAVFENGGTKTVRADVTFNDCVFYVKTGCLFDFNSRENTNTTVDFNCTVNGGKIVSDNEIAANNLVRKNDDDTFVFGKSSDTGKYTELELKSGVAPITQTFNGGTLMFVKQGVSGGYDVYGLEAPKADVVTDYGTIPGQYNSAEGAPIVVFKADKTFIGAYSEFGAAMAAINTNGDKDGTYVIGEYNIILRANASQSIKATQNSFKGVTVNLDMNGFTLTKATGSAGYIFDVYAGAETFTDRCTYNVKNGKFVKADGAALFCVNYGTNLAKNAVVNYVFENVTFASTGSGTNVIFATWEGGSSKTTDTYFTTNATFNKCVFDYKSSSDNAIMFPMHYNKKEFCVYNVTVNGGTIIAKSERSMNRFIDMNATGDYADSIVFGKDSDGNYTKLILPADVAAPTSYIVNMFDSSDIAIKTNGGIVLTFVKVSSDTTTSTYTLYEKDNLTFTPKMSITLGNELVMNVYVPASNVEAFTLGTDTYNSDNNFGGKLITLENGESYYIVSVEFGSSEAANELKLVATVNLGNAIANATFTFSIPKYAAKVLDDANATDIEKALVTDVLAYIKAAYEYFTGHNSEDEIIRVTSLVESVIGDYVPTPTTSGTTATVLPVTSVTLNLDAKPAIRFYVTDITIEFYANGKKLNTVTGKDEIYGDYIELDVYAYALCETISYGEGGSYHISNYLEGSIDTDYEALVKAFVKYVESAADYRESVIARGN